MLVNNVVLTTPGSGATLATNSPGSGTTEYHVAIPATAAGHLAETEPTYSVQLPLVDSVANRYHFELFNGSGSTFTLLLRELRGLSSTDTVSPNNLSMRFDFFRTTAFSSGGTNHTNESSATAAANIARYDTQDSSLPSGITCKTVLTSITTGAWLFTKYIPAEATAAARWDATMADRMNRAVFEAMDEPGIEFMGSKRLILYPGQGVACRQGTVASAWSFSWFLQFTAV